MAVVAVSKSGGSAAVLFTRTVSRKLNYGLISMEAGNRDIYDPETL